MHQPPIPQIDSADPQIAELIHDEARRQAEKIRLIPSENYVSLAVLEAMRLAVLTNKYSEGYAGKRGYEGQQFIDPIESSRGAARKEEALFGADCRGERAAVLGLAREHGGLPGVRQASAKTVMGMALPMGGHLTHGAGVSVSGRWFNAVQYGVRRDTGRIDMDEVRDLALRERSKIIFAGGTAIPRTIDFPAFAAIATAEVDAVLVADMADIGFKPDRRMGAHPSPCGPRARDHHDHCTSRRREAAPASMILTDAEHATPIDEGGLPRPAGRPAQPHHRRNRVVALRKRPSRLVLYLRRADAQGQSRPPWRRRSPIWASTWCPAEPTTTCCSSTLTSKGIGGKPAAKALDRGGIELNFNTVPFDTRRPLDFLGHPPRHARDHHPRPDRAAHATDRRLDRRRDHCGRQGRRRGARHLPPRSATPDRLPHPRLVLP